MHNEPTQPARRRRRLLVGALLGLCAAFGAYAAYWHYVAGELAAGVESWAADQRAMGNQADFIWDGIGGFPFAFRADFAAPHLRLRLPGGEVVWQGSDLRAEMAPWNLRRVRVSSAGAHDLRLLGPQDAAWHLTATAPRGEATFHGNGALDTLRAELQRPRAELPDGRAIPADAASFGLTLPESAPVDYSQPFAGLSIDLDRVALPAGTRLLTTDPVEDAQLEATIMGPVAVPAASGQPPEPALELSSILAAWRDAGGDVEVKSFNFAQGPLTASGEATLALDGDLQLLGAGTVTTTGLSDAVEILLADGLIPADRALLVRTTAKALERLGEDGRKQAKFALSVQNRIVSFGPAPLFALPAIVWP